MSRVAYPFLTLSPLTVETSSWQIARAAGEFQQAVDYLSDWDYATPLHVRRTIEVNLMAAKQDLDLDAGELALAAAVRVGTGPGRMPRAIIRQEWRDLTGPVTFELEIPGNLLSSTLHLRTSIILAREPLEAGELSPRKVGDRLWSDEIRIRLEGEDPRFPIEVADFRALLGSSAAGYAPWYLHWSPHDWGRDFHGALRLYLNRDHEPLVAKVEAEDPETLRFLMADVMGQVCEALLRDDDAADIVERCEEGALGWQAWNWLALAFPDHDLARMKSVLEDRPGAFRAAFLALAEQKEIEA